MMIRILVILLFLGFIGCSPQKENESAATEAPEKGYVLVFNKIDNQARVYVNGKQIFDSGPVDGNPDLQENVELGNYLQPGDNEVRVELYNGGTEMTQYRSDTNWEVRYEIFESGESVDFGYESSKTGSEGLVYEMVHSVYKY